MSTLHPSAESPGLHPLPLPPSAQTPRASRAAALLRHGRRGALPVALLAAAGSVCGLALSENGPAALSAAAELARRGWPAVALAVSFVAFVSVLRVVTAVLGAVGMLAEQLRAAESRTEATSRALVRIEENQEQMAIVLERLVERTQPGMGPPPPMSSPPQGPQRV